MSRLKVTIWITSDDETTTLTENLTEVAVLGAVIAYNLHPYVSSLTINGVQIFRDEKEDESESE